VTGFDLYEPGSCGTPGMMVGLVKIHQTINANDYNVVAEAEAILAGAEAPALV
jgi:hypothetical protein